MLVAQFRFEFLLTLAIDEREESAKKLQVAQSLWLDAQAKMEQIDTYRSEYRRRLTSSGHGGMTVMQWRDFQLFLAKLDEAAAQQLQLVSNLEQRYQQSLHEWREREKKVKGFEMLKSRHLADEQRLEGVREQKMLDEFNARGRSSE